VSVVNPSPRVRARVGKPSLAGLIPLRAAATLAVLGAALALGACGSSGGGGSTTGKGGAIAGSLTAPGLYGKLPPQGTPTHGGTITYGQLKDQTPNYTRPLVP